MKSLKKRKLIDKIVKGFIYICVTIVSVLLISMIIFIFIKGFKKIDMAFLTTSPSPLKNTIGILPNIVNTLLVIIFTLIISIPIGIGAAIYLNEYATNKKVVSIVEFAIETLSGIPSIIYGLVGMLFFVQFLKLKTSLWSGCLTLVIMILPTIIRTTQESLRTVPDSYRDGAIGLGATKWYMIRTIILPNAINGILTGIILSVGRIVGESAALMFTAGVGTKLLPNIFKSMSQSGGTLSVGLYMYVFERGEFDVGFAMASILVIISLAINVITKIIKFKMNKE